MPSTAPPWPSTAPPWPSVPSREEGEREAPVKFRAGGAHRLAHLQRPIHRPANSSPDASPRHPDLRTQFLLSGTASLAIQKKGQGTAKREHTHTPEPDMAGMQESGSFWGLPL